jgi:glycosyltransferase involved in cell wall biosynthesis
MRIALLGTRGIPANYGGFETFAEELSVRLVKRGHQVTVYCREKYPERQYRGVNVVYLPSIRHKYFDTLAHTCVSTLHLLTHRVDVALYCNAANAIFTILPRMLGMPVALNVDGIERKRKKWNRFAKAWYLMSERLATFLPNEIVTDAQVIEAYYQATYRKRSTFIAYGADMIREESTGALDELCLEKKGYFLYVSRLEPENHALMVRQAFEKVPTKLKLAIIGSAPHGHDYIRQVGDTQDPRIVMPGAMFGKGYRELGSHCFAYVQATEVGGTHPALIEAMGRGALVIYRSTPENVEVCGGVGLPFNDESELVARMRQVSGMSEAERASYGQRAEARVKARYDWEVVTTQYEQLLAKIGHANLG